jgi:aminoglycoside phosphotransferase (APT) family kinase protein
LHHFHQQIGKNDKQIMIISVPPTEIALDELLVKKLIDAQFPDLSHLSIQFLDSGWDNNNYRLGTQYIVRIPRRKAAVASILNEINWLPKLQAYLPIQIPTPIKVGEPDHNYPWHWTITPWFEGKTVDGTHLNTSEALRIAQFLKILHSQNADNAPINLHRGIPLSEKNEDVLLRMERLKKQSDLINPKIEQLWQQAVKEPFPSEIHLLHGDLHPRNILIHDKKFAAIIDWGDITSGDVATDLACLWMVFSEKNTRQKALKYYRAGQSLINRSIGWAINFGTILLDTGLNGDPSYTGNGFFILKNLNNE